jgi:hypothetical protein
MSTGGKKSRKEHGSRAAVRKANKAKNRPAEGAISKYAAKQRRLAELLGR